MLLGSRGTRGRCLLVWLLAGAGLALTSGLARPLAMAGWRAAGSDGLDRMPLDTALVALAAVTVVACAGWGWLAVTAEVLAAARGRTRSTGPCRLPDGVRRMVLAACGVALTGGVATPALADAHLTGHHHARQAQHGVSGLPLPERVAAPPHPVRDRDAARSARKERRTVVVAPGDSLWSIAAADLPRGAGAARISARWHALYAANRSVIGPDPDRIRPGQRLLLPGKER